MKHRRQLTEKEKEIKEIKKNMMKDKNCDESGSNAKAKKKLTKYEFDSEKSTKSLHNTLKKSRKHQMELKKELETWKTKAQTIEKQFHAVISQMSQRGQGMVSLLSASDGGGSD